MNLNDIQCEYFLEAIAGLRPNLKEYAHIDKRAQFIKEFSGNRRSDKIKSLMDAAYFTPQEIKAIKKQTNSKYIVYLLKGTFKLTASLFKGLIILILILFLFTFVWYHFFTDRVYVIGKEKVFYSGDSLSALSTNAPFDFLDDSPGFIKKSISNGKWLIQKPDFLNWLTNQGEHFYVSESDVVEGDLVTQYKECFNPLKGTAEYDSLRIADKKIIFHFLDSINKNLAEKYSLGYENPTDPSYKNLLAFDDVGLEKRVIYIKLDKILDGKSNAVLLHYLLNNESQHEVYNLQHFLATEQLGEIKFFKKNTWTSALKQLVLYKNEQEEFRNFESNNLFQFIK